MKKVLVSLAFAALIAVVSVSSMTSCRKVYTCTCSYNNQIVYTQDLGSQSQSNAEKQCNTYDSTITGETWACTVH